MCDGWPDKILKRKTVITGHYGSGKTEFAVSLAMQLTNAALIDLDIVNPYFRSRERRGLLASRGVSVYGCAFKKEITAELPALQAAIKAPLEDENTRVIADLGGNGSGALTINRFAKYFTGCDTITAAVVNANRPETSTLPGALRHIEAIEAATGLGISHIINNTHMLRETTAHDIKKGHEFCMEICRQSGRELLCNCYPKGIVEAGTLGGVSGRLFEMGLYMRPKWLDM